VRRNTTIGRTLALGLVTVLSVTTLVACGDDDEENGTAAEDTTSTSAGDSGGETEEGSEPADVGSMEVGLVCGGLTPMTAQVAVNTDAFAESGLEVEKICFDGGSEGVQALIGGGIDVFLGSYEHIASTRGEGLDMKGYAVINKSFPYWLLTKEDAPFTDVADLAGETVGVTSPGSLSDTGLKAAAVEADLDYAELSVIGAGSGAPMKAALDNDQIAAGMVSDPGISELTATGYRILWEPEFDYVSIVAVASEGWVQDNEAAMRAFLGTLQDTAEQMKEDPAFALEAMTEEGFNVSEDALRAAVERGIEQIPDGLAVDEAQVQQTGDILISVGKAEEPGLAFDEGFDFSYLR
jgi:NitT/TauT family transport system substrate-binding protein